MGSRSQSLQESRLNRLTNQITLYQALGGPAARGDRRVNALPKACAGPELDELDDDALIQAIGRRDQQAFALLMKRHAAFAMTLAQRVTGNADDADELVQEAFLRVWIAAPGWRKRNNARVSSWLYRIVLNLCFDRKRKAGFVPIDEIEEPVDTGPSGFENLSAQEARNLVTAALLVLPERQRVAVSLCCLGGVAGREAAEMLNLSLPALESLLARGRRAIRDHLLRRGLNKLGDLM